jgi:hypothetical protein
LHAERNFSLSFLGSSTEEIARQGKILLSAQYSAWWKNLKNEWSAGGRSLPLPQFT